MSSATWVSTISWLGALAGSGRPLMEVRSGCIMAPISVPSGGEFSIQSTSDDLRALVATELARAGQEPDHIAPKTLVPTGETRDIHRAGGCYLTLVGSNLLFHLPQDRWPHAVDPGMVARVAAAAARLVVILTR